MKNLFVSAFALMLSLGASAQSAGQYRNPVIPGYHPDPSVVKVGDDYYCVNSSFQYFPGVPISHSKDLIHWEQIGNVLDRESQLPLKDASSWLGIYAPTIRYHEGTYYMITTNVGSGGNFLVTATDPRGPWSEPLWLEQQGIDPSLYFEDGRCYMVSNPDGVITLCEIDVKTGKQLTPSKGLWSGMGGRYPEGPHIYKKDGYYYLLISEGGTELAHHLTIARSRDIYGPYEGYEKNPILTNCNHKGESKQIQGTGHGDFVQDDQGQWWVMFLAYRNMGGSYHHLGRETYVAPMEWKEGEWPVVYGGEAVDTLMTLPAGMAGKGVSTNKSYGTVNVDFGKLKDLKQLPSHFVYIQNPIAENYQLRKGGLRLTAHSTLTENQQPSYLGVRQTSDKMQADAVIDLATLRKENGGAQAGAPLRAGLSVYQIHDGHIEILTDGSRVEVRTRVKTMEAPVTYTYVNNKVSDKAKTLTLRIASNGLDYKFYFAEDGGEFVEVASQSCTLYSTEVVGGFTGVTLGMYAEGQGTATFKKFEFKEL